MKLVELTDWTAEGIRWPDPKKGPWYLRGRWAQGTDRPECIGLEIWKGAEPSQEPEVFLFGNEVTPIEGSDLRALPLGQLLRMLWEVQREAAAEAADTLTKRRRLYLDVSRRHPEREWFGMGDLAALGDDIADAKATAGTQRRRKKWDDEEHFAQVAAVYQQAVVGRLPPTKTVAETLHCSYATATKWVARARELGLLAKTSPGRPSRGTTTTKGKKR